MQLVRSWAILGRGRFCASLQREDSRRMSEEPRIIRCCRFPGFTLGIRRAGFQQLQLRNRCRQERKSKAATGKFHTSLRRCEERRAVDRTQSTRICSRSAWKENSDGLDAGVGDCRPAAVAGKTIWIEVDVSNGGEVYDLTIVEKRYEAQVEFTAWSLPVF